MDEEKKLQDKKIKHEQALKKTTEQEKNFLQQQIIESKRQNKLLKLAIGRLQSELERKEEQLQQQQSVGPMNIIGQMEMAQREADGNTFMTDVKGMHDQPGTATDHN